MLEAFDRTTRNRVAILENAFDIKEKKPMNALWSFSFSLPYNDPKNEYCKAFHYVRYNDGELYRIMDDGVTKTETGDYSYQCEHVLATLLDRVLFGYHVIGNLGTYTRDCIEYVLSKQLEPNWKLGKCDFTHQFEYGWEQENLLGALFSIPQPFVDKYLWTFDTHQYPWTLNLERLDTDAIPQIYIRNYHNLLDISRDRTRTTVCTRLYPLGYGEGVNQLGIKDINGGIPYIESPADIIEKYGIIERIWVDRRYESAESLLAAAQAMLLELQEPVEAYRASMADIHVDPGAAVAPGAVVRIIDTELGIDKTTFLTNVELDHGEILKSTIEIANRSVDIASTVADLADRQRIEQTYSQGATQIFAQSIQENADKDTGAVMDFFIPSEMRIINKVLCKVRVESFRTYSKTTSTAAQQSSTSSSGGASTATSSSGGGTSRSTDSDGKASVTSKSGGGTTETTKSGGSFNKTSGNVQGISSSDTGSSDGSKGYHTHTYGVGTHTHNVSVGGHTHDVTIPGHTHDVTVPAHSHDFSVPDHSHQVSIPSHTHDFTIPGHNHEIQAGIFRFGYPQTFGLYVNGVKVKDYSSTNEEIDLTDLLTDEDSGKIPRGLWHTVEVRPNDLAYICIALSVQGFVQSRGDATV